ncbi:hypothetical protein ACFQT0_28415 [Hymenobacter humi]|uniref:Uncharacterized protein n=1 Tax=Hymenobacter humi TaxID=1411620 RepID=A0ABW2UBL2_9BACT
MFNFQALTKKDWTTDYGFRKAFEANPGQMRFGGPSSATAARIL